MSVASAAHLAIGKFDLPDPTGGRLPTHQPHFVDSIRLVLGKHVVGLIAGPTGHLVGLMHSIQRQCHNLIHAAPP